MENIPALARFLPGLGIHYKVYRRIDSAVHLEVLAHRVFPLVVDMAKVLLEDGIEGLVGDDAAGAEAHCLESAIHAGRKGRSQT